jgi:hypothetical protein
MVCRSSVFSLSYLIAVLSLPFAGLARTARAQGPIVNIITPANASFAALLEEHFPGAVSQTKQLGLYQNSVLVVNNTRQRVRALSLRWSTIANGAVPSVRYSKIILVRPERIGLPGASTALLPGQFVFATPTGFILEDTPSKASRSSTPTPPATVASSVEKNGSVRIDSIIFGSGYAPGPDASGMIANYVCERNGPIDEDRSLLVLDGDAETQSHLTVDTSVEQQTAAGSACPLARAQEASRLLALFGSGRSTVFSAALKQGAFREKIALNRVINPPPIRANTN